MRRNQRQLSRSLRRTRSSGCSPLVVSAGNSCRPLVGQLSAGQPGRSGRTRRCAGVLHLLLRLPGLRRRAEPALSALRCSCKSCRIRAGPPHIAAGCEQHRCRDANTPGTARTGDLSHGCRGGAHTRLAAWNDHDRRDGRHRQGSGPVHECGYRSPGPRIGDSGRCDRGRPAVATTTTGQARWRSSCL